MSLSQCGLKTQASTVLSLLFILIFGCSYTLFAQPSISSFLPTSGPVGTIVTITGSNFSSVASNNTVFFGAVKAPVTAASSTSLTVTVPSGASYQPVTVTTNGLAAYASQSFDITFASGSITNTSFSAKTDFATGTNPNGLSACDIDGDGKPDLIVVYGTSPYRVSVYRNTSTTGAVSFAPKIDMLTGDLPYSVATGDLDGDGKPEIVVTNTMSNVLTVLRNISVSGTISFTSSNVSTGVVFPMSVSIGDVDADGKPDLITANTNANSFSVFRNLSTTGSISFAAKTDFGAGDSPRNASIGDLDGDGKPDIIVCNGGDNTVGVYRNQSAGGIIDFVFKGGYISTNPVHSTIADMDGDGKPEMVIDNNSSSSVSIFRNTSTVGAISFATRVLFGTAPGPVSLSIGDVDGDGKPDVVTCDKNYDSVSILRNTSVSGSVSFEIKKSFKTGGSPVSLALVDLDGDSKPEVATSNNTANSISVLKNDNTTQLLPQIDSFTPTTGSSGTTITIKGIRFTGLTDVRFGGVTASSFSVLNDTVVLAVVGAGATGDLTAVNAQGTGTKSGFIFVQPPTIISFSPATGPVGSTVTITGTSFSTVATGNTVYFGAVKATVVNATSTLLTVIVPASASYEPVTVTTNGLTAYSKQAFDVTYSGGSVTTTSFISKTDYLPGQTPTDISSSDLDGDGKPDLVVSCGATPYHVSIYRNTSTTGAITLAPKVDLTSGSGSFGVATGDLDGDGKPDIAVANQVANTVTVYRNTSVGSSISFTSITLTASLAPNKIAIGDLDADGKPEIIVTNHNANSFSVFKNTGTIGAMSFAAQKTFATGAEPAGLAVGDLDLDGKPEIAICNLGDNFVGLYKNSSTSTSISFTVKTNYSLWSPTEAAITDIDGDGKPDLAVVNISDGISIYRNMSTVGNIVMSTVQQYTSAYTLTSFHIGDLDGDGKPDIASCNFINENISLYRNTSVSGTVSFEPEKAFNSHKGPWEIMIADLDSDSKPDMVTVNTDSNSITVYKNGIDATQPKPTISSFTPTSAVTGTAVEIKGLNLTGTAGVFFGNTAAASYSVTSDTTITAVVAYGATGFVRIVSPGGADSLGGFTYTATPPVVNSFTPATAGPTQTITIKGLRFTGVTDVRFGGVAAAFSVLNDTVMLAIVGAGATGDLTVVSAKGTGSKSGFTFVQPPTITSFSPASGAVGSTVTITGTNFNAVAGNNAVYFGTVKANVVSASSTTLTVIVPAGATYQPVTVTANGLTAIASQSFDVTFSGSPLTSNSFAAGMDITTGESPREMLSGDVDGDGKPDLILGNIEASPYRVTIYRNTGTAGTVSFDAPVAVTIASVPYGIALADMSGDGKLDIVAAKYPTHAVAVFENLSTPGHISFSSYSTSAGYFPTRVAVGDLDGDGRPDVVTMNDGQPVISVLRNESVTGNIALSTSKDYAIGGNPVSMSIQDLDGDGKPDITVAGNGNISIFKNTSVQGAISFATRVDYQVTSAHWVSVADIDGDTKPEMIISGAVDSVFIFKNISTPGTISFAAKKGFAIATASANRANVEDIDGDGKPDLTFSGKTNNLESVTVLVNGSTGGNISFVPKVNFKTGINSWGLVAVDWDGDNRPDIATSNEYSNIISVYRYIGNAPEIASFSPNTGGTGTAITIIGKNFTTTTAVSIGGIPVASFTVVDSSTINAIVGTGATGFVRVTTTTGTDSLGGFTYVAPPVLPDITSFTPTSGTIGTTVTIKGAHFTGATAVVIGGTAASYTVVSDSTITAVVATGTVSGAVVVTTPNGADTLGGFTYVAPPVLPDITSFTPTSGTIGTTVTIKGAHFTGATAVVIGGTAASYTVVSDSTITAVVATGTVSGAVVVTTPNGADTLGGFTYVAPPVLPVITSFTPTSGTIGTTVTIKGAHFTGATAVVIGGTTASYMVVSDSTITAIVAAGTVSGSVVVTTPGGTGSLGGFTFVAPPLVVEPQISGFSPTSGTTGTIVTIKGNNFTGVTAVSFGGAPATSFTVVSDSTINAVVGTGNSGAVQITSSNGTDTLGGFMYLQGMTVAPNPASGFVIVNHPVSINVAVIKLISAMGVTVESVQVNPTVSQTRIDLMGVDQGIYIIWWTDGANTVSKTLMVK